MDVIYPKAYAFDDFDAQREVHEQNPVDEDVYKRQGLRSGSVPGRQITYSFPRRDPLPEVLPLTL